MSRPRILISKCLGFDHCRYNGAMLTEPVVEMLRPEVDFLPVCPEMEIGLGVPREPVRVISAGDRLTLFQPATNRDVTAEMVQFSERFLQALPPVDGCILKGRSPSCGIKEVKIYPGPGKTGAQGMGRGFFGQAVIDACPQLAVEEEGRLKNLAIRQHFLTRLFSAARFRALQDTPSMRELVRFHSEMKLLLMAYHQTELRAMGRIVANPEKKSLKELLADYEIHLWNALNRTPRRTSHINVLMHALGYFSKELSAREKAFFLDALERYRSGRSTLNECLAVIRSWLARFDQPYLEDQKYFQPFPEELIELSDSGKGRNRG